MTTTDEAPAVLPRRVRRGYAAGSLVTGAFGTVPGLLLLPYLTDTIGVAAGVASVLILLPKAWDVVVNPLAGRLSDRTTSRWGARRPYLLAAGVATALTFALLFAGPAVGTAGAVYVAVAFLVTATAYAFFQVPYVAMPAEITTRLGDPPGERTRLMTWRVAVLAVAILVSGALAPAIRDAAGGGLAGYRVAGAVIALVMLAGAIWAFLGTRDAPAGPVQASEPSIRRQLQVARRNRPFLVLAAVWVVQSAGVATMLAGTDYVAAGPLDDQGLTSVLFVCFVGPALVTTPLWARFGARAGKRAGLVASSVLFAAGGILLLAGLLSGTTVVALAAAAVVGCGYTGEQVFALAMLPDVVDADERATGRRQAGVFTGLWTGGETLAFALGPGLFGLILQVGGYRSGIGAGNQDGGAELAATLGFTLVPVLLMLAPLPLLRRYRLPSTEEIR